MAGLLAANRVKQTTTTTGTGALTFSGSVAGYHPFSAIPSGGMIVLPVSLTYLIEWGAGSFELGVGTLNEDVTLSRERVLQNHDNYEMSGTGNAFDLPAGTKTVSVVTISHHAIQCWTDNAQFDPGYGAPLAPVVDASRAMAVGLSAYAMADSSIALGFGAGAIYDKAVQIGAGDSVQDHCLSRMRNSSNVESYTIDHMANGTAFAAGSEYIETVLVGIGEVFTGTIHLACKAATGGKYAGWKIDVVASRAGIIGSTITAIGSDLASTPTITLEMGLAEGVRSNAYPLYIFVNNAAGGVSLRFSARTHGMLIYNAY